MSSDVVKYHYASMADDPSDVAAGRGESEREHNERRYVAALTAMDIAAEPSPTVAASLAAAAQDIARLNAIWQPDGGVSRGLFGRIAAELGRLMPWRRRRLLGALIAAVNRNADATRTLADATQNFQSHVIWYAQAITAIAISRRGQIGPHDIEPLHKAINALGTDWLSRWESLTAREVRSDTRMDALTRAYEELKAQTALAEARAAVLKQAIDALHAPEDL
ncbi:MAG TPA: hypothetical protein VFV78_11845 [Vicinamibacterales bacterium]|nr:hypothetical protein [Vicinamibacterales bacterium]